MKRACRPRWVALILCACAAALLCCACAAPTPAGPTAEPDPFAEHLDISIGYWNVQEMLSGREDALRDYIEARFNITLLPQTYSWTDYEERYRIMSTSHALPDVFATVAATSASDPSYMLTMVDIGAIRPLPEDLSRFPHVQEAMALVDFYQGELDNYFFPRISFVDPILGSSDAALLVRKDWMEALGIEQVASLDDFVEMARAFAQDDPDGNGIDDTIGFNVNTRVALGKWLFLGIAPKCNTTDWIEQDGRFVPSVLAPDYVEALKALRRLYETGGLDPLFHIKKAGDAVDDFARGKLGALEHKSSPSAILEVQCQWALYDNPPFEEAVGVLPIFPAPDGNRYANASSIFWSETYFSAGVDDAKMERILYLLDFLLSDEGRWLTKYGIEGIDYTFEQGEYVCLLDASERGLSMVLHEKYPSMALFASFASWGGTPEDFEQSPQNYLRFGEHAVNLAHESLAWNRENTIQVDRPFDFILMTKAGDDPFGDEPIADQIVPIIVGDGDVEAMWAQRLAAYAENGLEDYIRQQNELYRARIGTHTP